MKKDQEYAQYIATANSDERNQSQQTIQLSHVNRDDLVEHVSTPGNVTQLPTTGETVMTNKLSHK